MTGNWSNLPADVARDIADRLLNDADYACFRSVCTSWRSSTSKRPQIPFLIFGNSPTSLYLWRISNGDEIPFELPQEAIVCGSSLGWIFLLDDSLAYFIYNPFTGRKIPLPPLPEMPYRVIRSGGTVFVKELDVRRPPTARKHFHDFNVFYYLTFPQPLMSSDPATAPDDCIVVTPSTRTKTLIYCRPGDTAWTSIAGPTYNFTHYIFYKGRLYAVYSENDFESIVEFRLFVCTLEPGARATEILHANPLFSDGDARDEYSWNEISLAVSCGDLLVVAFRFDEDYDSELEICEVFRVDLSDGGQLRLVKLENLGGHALFVSLGSSSSVYRGDSTYCKGNCVYTANRPYFFNLEDGGNEYLAKHPDLRYATFVTPG